MRSEAELKIRQTARGDPLEDGVVAKGTFAITDPNIKPCQLEVWTNIA